MVEPKHIMVTGGAGYIGSHTCVELLNIGYRVSVLDNLSNSCEESLRRVEQLTGKKLDFHRVDLADIVMLEKTFSQLPDPFAVIHFAGLKSLNESIEKPLSYYHNNITGTLNLCKVMQSHDVKNIVFSSSASVYGVPDTVPIREDFPVSCTNPYGRSKIMVEDILHDIYRADPTWNCILLRYFNPVGAHKSGLIGEDPNEIPNNLVPYISQVAIGKLKEVLVYGDDYDTPDGTGVRDYIHVVDLAVGHLKALQKMTTGPGMKIYNLGTGRGYSVLEMINAFGKASGREIPYKIVDRRPGDVGACWADASLALQEIGWHAQRGVEEMCEDAWRWQKNNPHGYDEG
ncbi:MAG: UDP-glucose 4-epimerase GalE [Desulfobulbaceae bacterium]|nr:UDP-glucose 4-epimerase GalE [Desulfobulbaceae bacterium]